MKPVYLPLAAVLFLLSACVPPRVSAWEGYESSLHGLMLHPQNVDTYGKRLFESIESGESVGNVPSGIYAEYGYVLLQMNKPREATTFFEKEKARWPESSIFMDKLIISCGSDHSVKNNNSSTSAQAVASQNGPIVPAQKEVK